jgi:predicted Ser/Thr protein kinase
VPESRPCILCGADREPGSPEGLCPECLARQGIVVPHEPGTGAEPGATAAYTPGFVAPSAAELAGHFPHLEVLELVGRGGMGAVYKARQPALDRLVALKVLPTESGRDSAFAERFMREARSLARLNHPGIVAVYDFGHGGGLYYFLMEYVDGVNLRQLLRRGELTPARALQIVPQLCEALQYAHEEGVIHRDVKPENILLDRRGRVKIADFGLAKLVRQAPADLQLTRSSQVMGTLYYMAPEQLESPLSVDHRADIYSLGVVFYEMLTGGLPLGRFALPSQKAPVDARLDDVVLRALEKEPDRRYQHAREVKTEVELITAGPQPSEPANPARAPRPVTPLPLPRRRAYENEDEHFVLPPRESPESYTRAAVGGMLCSMGGLLLLVLAVIVGVFAEAGWRRSGGSFVWVSLALVIVSFILCLLGTVFGSRGMNPANGENRGLAVTGLACGIVGMVLGTLAGLFFFCAGMLSTVTRPRFW